MSKTKRIQLKHTKGWKLPMNTVSVSGFSKWANPYKAPRDGSRTEVVELYRKMLLTFPQTSQGFSETDSYMHTLKQELGGKDLACWCPLDVPCHADVLLELAREMDERRMKWQPIETAPTDGTRILLRGRNGKIADGHYGQPDGFANPKRFVWPYVNANPTHWAPLGLIDGLEVTLLRRMK